MIKDDLIVYFAIKAMVSLLFLKDRVQDDDIKLDLDMISESVQEILKIVKPDTSPDFEKRMIKLVAEAILGDNPQILPSLLKKIGEK